MFEKLKQNLLEKIERNAVKSECTYQFKKHPEPITEIVYLKRSKMPLVGDWGRIYPPVNEDGSWNFTNLIFGGKKNLIKLIFIGVIIGMVFFEFNHVFNVIEALRESCPKILLP